jgi:hypothetical protein
MFTKDQIKLYHADIKKALEEVAKKHKLTLGNSTRIVYNADTFKFTAEFGDASGSTGAPAIDPKYLNNMKRYGWEFNLEVSDIGKRFQVSALGECELTGMSGRIKAGIKQLSTGKNYIMRAEQVAVKLGKKATSVPLTVVALNAAAHDAVR